MGTEEQEDDNQIRRYAVSGHMYMFEYKAKTANKLPYYDTFPLVYVIKATRHEFWGLNLHYLTPKRRAWVVKRLFEGRIDAPRKCFHKYLTSYDDIGVTLEFLRSPSGTDAWHYRRGYCGSPKAVEGFIHSKNNGQIAHLTHIF